MASLRKPTREDVEAAKLFVRDDLPEGLKEGFTTGMRWSYIAVAVLVVLGGVINYFFAHGWTVWPLVAAVAFVLYIHEAAERNGQGIPPLHVYALLAGGLVAFIVTIVILKALNPLIILAAVGFIAYHSIRAWLAQREAERIVTERRDANLCVHCGEPSDPRFLTCSTCGEEPDPAGLQVQRVAAIVRARKGAHRARTVLTREKATAGAARKEAALLARRVRKSNK